MLKASGYLTMLCQEVIWQGFFKTTLWYLWLCLAWEVAAILKITLSEYKTLHLSIHLSAAMCAWWKSDREIGFVQPSSWKT